MATLFVQTELVPVAQLRHLLPRPAHAKLAQPRLRKPLEEAPRGLEKGKDFGGKFECSKTFLKKRFSLAVQ